MPKATLTVTIPICTHQSLLHPETNTFAPCEVPAYLVSEHLALTPNLTGMARTTEMSFGDMFVITHRPSGFSLGGSLRRFAVAKYAFARFLAVGGDHLGATNPLATEAKAALFAVMRECQLLDTTPGRVVIPKLGAQSASEAGGPEAPQSGTTGG